MNDLRAAITDYLDLRRSLGFKLKTDELYLRNFAAFMERRHATHITIKLAEKWARQPASTTPTYHAGRLRAVRSFARYRIHTDPRTEILPQTCCPGSGPPSSPISSARRKWSAFWRQAGGNGPGLRSSIALAAIRSTACSALPGCVSVKS